MRTILFQEVLHTRERGPWGPERCDISVRGGTDDQVPKGVSLDSGDPALIRDAAWSPEDFWEDVVLQTDGFVQGEVRRVWHDGGDVTDDPRGLHGGGLNVTRQSGALPQEAGVCHERVLEGREVRGVEASDKREAHGRRKSRGSRLLQATPDRSLEPPRMASRRSAPAERPHQAMHAVGVRNTGDPAAPVGFVRVESLLQERIVLRRQFYPKRVCFESFMKGRVSTEVNREGAL